MRSAEERLPWGPLPHRDLSKRRLPLPGESRPRGHVPSSTFLTSSTVCSATCLRGLVSSRCHVQGLPFRGLSLARSRTGFPRPFHALLSLDAPAFDQPARPRLQGFVSPRRVRCRSRRFRSRFDPRPSWACCSSGCSLRASWGCLHIPSTHGLHCEEPLAAGPRRFADTRIGLPGTRLPTRSSFPT